MRRPSFSERVLRLLKEIPRGKVTTYRLVARRLGTNGFRAVGNALHGNSRPDEFPCYKVVRSDGRIGGYALGTSEKIRRLEADGVKVRGNKIAGFESILHDFR
ncbi:MAG: MGMT family protein [Candidatus Micrarchaeota archaeon]